MMFMTGLYSKTIPMWRYQNVKALF